MRAPDSSLAVLAPRGDAAISRWMFESSPDCVKLLDLDGNLLEMNRNGQCTMEIDDFSAVCGAAWSSLWPKDSRGEIDTALAAARGGQLGRFQAFCPTAKGTPKWWDVTVTPVLDAAGSATGLLSVSRDVTALVRAQEDARETAARLKFALEAAQIGEWELDLSTGRARGSLRHAQCFGFEAPPPQWSFDSFMQHVHPDDRAQVQAGFDAALREGTPWRAEARVVWPDGSLHWISLHGSLYQPPAGQPARLLGTVADITDQKLSMALATGQQQALEMAVAGAPLQGVLDTLARSAEASSGSDAIATVLLCDEQGRLRRGAAPSMPESYSAQVDGLETGPAAGSCGSAAYLKKPVVVEDIATDARWVAYRALAAQHGLRACWSQPILTSSGKVLGTVAAYHRQPHQPQQRERESMALLANTAALVLERHRAHEEQRSAQVALQVSEERLRTLVEATASIVWATSPRGEFSDEQSGWSAYTGQAPGEAAGWGWLDAVHPDDRRRTGADLQDAIARRAVCELEHRVRRLDGDYRHMQMRAVPILDASGALREYVGIHVDITARRAAEQDLRQLAEQLQEANRRKTEFLATLAHELRNPLAPIRNALELIRLSGDDQSAVRRVRELMTRQVQHMVRLVDDLLDVARVSRGKLVLQKERVPLGGVVSAAVEASLPLMEAGRHQLQIAMAEQELLVEVDATRITQVVTNLLNNAAKYTPAGGRIELRVQREEQQVRIAVADNGVGLDVQDLREIFEMFAQVGTPTARAQGGLGIGLTLARELVQLHGGRLEAHSDGLGQGSTFTVVLPLPVAAATPDAAREAPESEVPQESSLRVLVVDDNVDAGETLAALIGLHGFAVQSASDGPAGLAAAREFRPDLVFIDIGMPAMDGYEVARMLRQMPQTRKATLVALTGWGAKEDQERAYAAGFDRHLTKPADPQKIRDALALATARRTQAQA